MQKTESEIDVVREPNSSFPFDRNSGSISCRIKTGACPDRKMSPLAFLPIGLSLEHSELLLRPAVANMPLPMYEGIKRSLDILIVLLAVPLIAPMAFWVALLIWCEDRGPILYGQERVGLSGKPFTFYKFRSMVPDADRLRVPLEAQNEAVGPIFKMRNDPRVTRVGRVLRKYSLDELPQLLHVLFGHMSLVGPRPHLPREVAHYTEEQYERLAVRPGLVCLREVCGRSHLAFEEWVALDLMYVRHRNLVLDGWVLLRLIPAVIRADGAF